MGSEQLVGVGSLSMRGSPGPISGHHAWQQVSSAPESSRWPKHHHLGNHFAGTAGDSVGNDSTYCADMRTRV